MKFIYRYISLIFLVINIYNCSNVNLQSRMDQTVELQINNNAENSQYKQTNNQEQVVSKQVNNQEQIVSKQANFLHSKCCNYLVKLKKEHDFILCSCYLCSDSLCESGGLDAIHNISPSYNCCACALIPFVKTTLGTFGFIYGSIGTDFLEIDIDWSKWKISQIDLMIGSSFLLYDGLNDVLGSFFQYKIKEKTKSKIRKDGIMKLVITVGQAILFCGLIDSLFEKEGRDNYEINSAAIFVIVIILDILLNFIESIFIIFKTDRIIESLQENS